MNSTPPGASDRASITQVYWSALADFPARAFTQWHARLEPHERARAALFQRPLDRDAFIMGRALAAELATRAGIRFRLEAANGGKPRLAVLGGHAPDLSISHSGGWVAVAMGGAAQVGVDLEPVDREVDPVALARRFFSHAELQLLLRAGPEERRSRFLAAWTLKEAWAKSTGQGLSADLASVRLDPTGSCVLLAASQVDWTVSLYRPHPAIHLSVALHHPGRSPPAVHFWRARPVADGWHMDHEVLSPAASNLSATCATSMSPAS